MIRIDSLMLISAIDIPFMDAQVNIHQPTIREIAYINEENFFIGCNLLCFDKEQLTTKDKNNLSSQSNFDIVMSIMLDKEMGQENGECAFLVLTLLFPKYQIQLTREAIVLIDEQQKPHFLNSYNFSDFQKILNQMFCLKSKEKEYNFGKGKMSQQIADKLKERNQKLKKLKPAEGNIAVYSRFVSILAVGECKDMNILTNYTPYQLFDEYDRFTLKQQNDEYFQIVIHCGTKDQKQPENWKKDIHE